MEPGSTGDERVDAVLAVLGTLPGTPVAGHVAVFERVHLGLQEVLADTDGPARDGRPAG
ncbi:hypothetical protein [Actinocorallia populi]|uniref:hypothetical protein n=1 Tax=Actinocorallia populi TaxID=2079200 RepID=UPI0018E58112|nr:hypothetical protein [Actinocorallia populi]